MSLFSRIASFLRNPARTRRRLHCIQQVTVTLPEKMNSEFLWLVCPLPAATSTQEIDGAPVYTVPPTELKTDPTYGNRYATWRLSGAPGSSITITGTHTVIVRPTHLTLSAYDTTVFNESTDSIYLQNTAHLSSGDARIQEVANAISRREPTVAERVRACNEYVKSRLTYGAPIPGLYSATQALELPAVDCGGYATLLVSLLIACGIPARIVSGFWLDGGKNTMHAWAEAQVAPGVWLPLDPSVESLRHAGRSKKIAAPGEIGSDRLRLSVGCDITVTAGETAYVTDILQCPEVYPRETGATVTHHIRIS